MTNMLSWMGSIGSALQARGLLVAGIVVTLGQWSEAVDLITVGVDSARSQFTNAVEYERLGRLRVGNPADFAESIVGQPEIVRRLDDHTTANYFFDDKYLLTLLYREGRVEGMTVLALRPDFYFGSDPDFRLFESRLSNLPPPTSTVVDDAATGGYFVEAHDRGRSSMFLTRYIGVVDPGSEAAEWIRQLYRAETLGENEADVDELRRRVRVSVRPNFYGEGLELPVSTIRDSLLTPAEFGYYARGL